MNDTADAGDHEGDEDLAYGGICPVCGDEFTDGFDRLDERQSIKDVRMCIVNLDDGGAEALFHLPDDQSPPGEIPEHFVVADINGVQITGPPHTFEYDAEDDLEMIDDADAVEDARVVSYE